MFYIGIMDQQLLQFLIFIFLICIIWDVIFCSPLEVIHHSGGTYFTSLDGILPHCKDSGYMFLHNVDFQQNTLRYIPEDFVTTTVRNLNSTYYLPALC